MPTTKYNLYYYTVCLIYFFILFLNYLNHSYLLLFIFVKILVTSCSTFYEEINNTVSKNILFSTVHITEPIFNYNASHGSVKHNCKILNASLIYWAYY